MKHIAFIVIGVSLLMIINDTLATRAFFFAAYLMVVFFNLEEKNILTLAISLVFFKLLEVSTHEIFKLLLGPNPSGFLENNVIFGTHFFYDTLLLLLVAFRAPIWRELLKNDTKEIHLTNADMGLVVVYSLFIIADLAAIGENITRNLEHIGFSVETAKPYWSWQLVWDNYENIKRTLLGIEFLTVWLVTTPIAREKFNNRKLKWLKKQNR